MLFRSWSALVVASLVCCFSLPSTAQAQAVERLLMDASVAALACRTQEVLTPPAFGSRPRQGATIRIGRTRVVERVTVASGYVASCLREVYLHALDSFVGNFPERTVVLSAELPAAVSSRGLDWLLVQLKPKLATCADGEDETDVMLSQHESVVRLDVSPPYARGCVHNQIRSLLGHLSAIARRQGGSGAYARVRLRPTQDGLVRPSRRASRPDPTASRTAASRRTTRPDEVLVPEGWRTPNERGSNMTRRTRRTTMRNAGRRPRRSPGNEVLTPFGP